jgi:hypothetical protein
LLRFVNDRGGNWILRELNFTDIQDFLPRLNEIVNLATSDALCLTLDEWIVIQDIVRVDGEPPQNSLTICQDEVFELQAQDTVNVGQFC